MRKSLPTHKRIIKWWTSDEGQSYIDKLELKHGLSLDKLRDIDDNNLHCWSCFKDVSSSKRLERCHIIPDIHNGSNKPHNLFLMCPTCHKESPTINDEYYFLEWFEQSKHHAYRWIEYIQKQVNSLTSTLSESELENVSLNYGKVIKDVGAVPVAGQFSDSTRKVIIRESIKAVKSSSKKGEQQPSKKKSNQIASYLFKELKLIERKALSERSKNVIEGLKEKGRKYGNLPLGYTVEVREDGSQYIVQSEEQRKIDLVRSWRAEGLTFKEIQSRCKDQNISTRRGNVPTISNLGRWCKGVEMPKKVKEVYWKRYDKGGRPSGFRAHNRKLDQDKALKDSLISLALLGLTQRKIAEGLDKKGFLTSKGNPYDVKQIQRWIKELKEEGVL
tara:strand:+ start:479 stop:1642 length:1164 start_codon:yes stop_codon:yes gene_type:complete